MKWRLFGRGKPTNERESMSNVEQPEAEPLTPPAEVPTGEAPPDGEAGLPRLWNDGLTQYSDDGGQTWVDAGEIVPQGMELAEVDGEPEQVVEGPPLGEPEATMEGKTLPEPGQVTS